MSKLLKVLSLALSFAIISPQASQADWTYESGFDIDIFAQYRVDNEQSTIHFNEGFTVSIAEVLNTPQVSGVASAPQEPANYAVVVDGVVDKIVTWDGYSPNDDIDKYGLIVKLPTLGGVKYLDSEGVVRLAVITQGSVLQLRDLFDTTTYTEPLGDPVPFDNTPVVTSQVVAPDNSVTITVAVPVVDVPVTSTVTVIVVTDGRSTTSVGLPAVVEAVTAEPAATTVTVSNLPQGENVTVKVVVHDTITNTDTVVVAPIVTTQAATIVTPEPARDAVVDKATVIAPVVVAQAESANGHRSANIQVPDITNFDPNATWVTLMVVDKNGSTTAMGLDGVGKVVTVDWLSPTEEYSISIVLRDLATGKETVIAGNRLP
jgi:hypothetical protein